MLCETTPIRFARVERHHSAAVPSEQCFKLRDGCTGFRVSLRRELAQTMRRFFHASRVARLAKDIPERLFRERLTALAADEMQIAGRAGRERGGKRGVEWYWHFSCAAASELFDRWFVHFVFKIKGLFADFVTHLLNPRFFWILSA